MAKSLCSAPASVCASQKIVFHISSFDPAASAVRISKDLLVTNRHVVADKKTVKIFQPSGEQITALVIPTAYDGDLVLLRAKLPDGPVAILSDKSSGLLFTIGHDQRRKQIRIYKPGQTLLLPDSGFPFSRLHHTALSQPGNSGGAVVNEKGEVVAIATSGGSGRSEAIPAKEIAKLKNLSGKDHQTKHIKIGEVYRTCILQTEKYQRVRRLSDDNAAHLIKTCSATHNRQLLEITGQILGRTNRLKTSALMFERSLVRDPNAINARLGYLVTLHLSKRYKDEVPILRDLMQIVPREALVQRFAIQVGKQVDDQYLINNGLALIKQYAPERLPAAKRFLGAKP